MDDLPDPRVRHLSIDEAARLEAGAPHYRAFVGPPDRYDFMSASQFALLFALGLRDHHNVLDFGCGSLRLGRLLIPYLQPGKYFAIEPNKWLVEDAIRCELGPSIIEIKRPTFSYNADFCCSVFDRSFRFMVAQSIITHTGIDLTEKLASEMAKALADDGRVVFSIIEASDPFERPTAEGWLYPNCVSFGQTAIRQIFQSVGLTIAKLIWYHPGATWYIAARHKELLPALSKSWLLRGGVLFDEQFAESTKIPTAARS